MFEPGDTIADRYQITRFVGRGGMGEVYEAEDLDLEVTVALKTVRPEIADHEVALERFRREIQLARKVTHPNVCRIFDVGHHHLDATADEDEREIVFLTMEHLEGPTLANRIREQGRLDEGTALPILQQMAAAIDAAHHAGIVHRDFKSSNVILVENDTFPGGTRAVVTDFGLARGILPGDALTTSLSSSSQALGTPTYMAPEQVAGSQITPAVDIYALGIVVYEMMTGRPPFVSDSPLTTAVKRLTESPPPPRSLAPDLSSRWEAGILRCLERNPDSRFKEARDLARFVNGLPISTSRASILRSHHSLIAGLLLIVLLAVAIGLFWYGKTSDQPPFQAPETTAVTRPLAAVIGFRNLSATSDNAWLSTAFQEMLSMELAASEQVRVVPGDIVARVRRELGIEEFRSLTTDEINRIARNLGADLVVLGSYFVEDGSSDPEIRVDVRAHRSGAEEVISPVIETGTRSELLKLVSRTGERLRMKLGFGADGADTTTALVASYPVNADATMLYARGLEALRRGDPIDARAALENSIEIEPRNPLAFSTLASAWSSLGYDTRAREAARQAMELSQGLPIEERLLIEGRYREAASEWGEAVKIYKRLWRRAPDNVEYGLALARAQAHAGDSAALETIARLDELASDSSDPRIDLAEAEAAEALGDFPRERDAARRAAQHASKMDASVLLAQAKLAEWWAERNMGNLEDASRVSAEALEISRRSEDRSLVARALNAIATTKRQMGQTREARDLDLESLRIFREIGDARRQSWALNNLGRASYEEGDFSEALAYYNESLAIAREIDDSQGISRALGNIGNIFYEQGRMAESEAMFRETLQRARQSGDRRSLPWSMTNLAGTIADTGNLPDAERLLEEAIAGFRNTGERRGEGWALKRRGELYLYADQPKTAEFVLRDALKIFQEIGDERATNWTRMSLAEALLALDRFDEASHALATTLSRQNSTGDRFGEAVNLLLSSDVALADGDPALAEEQASRAETVFESLNLPNRKAEALAAQSRALLARGNPERAREAIERGLASVKNRGDERLELEIEITNQRVRAVTGKKESVTRLEEARRRAEELGYHDLAARASSILESIGPA